MRLGRLLLSLALALYAALILSSADRWSFLDNVNVPIHETGHLLFAFGSEQLTALGGTIFQLLVPLAIAGSFAMRRDGHAVTVGVWWCGQNCVNIGRYMADAVVQELPLVGGSEHDWGFLFGEWNVLAYAERIGQYATTVGGVIMFTACALGVLIAVRSAPPESVPATH